jgi:uncharacterized OB-fold protein
METWKGPLPVESGETKPFWDACRRGTFLIQRCRTCERYQYHYRGFCCHCWTGEIEDIPVSGRGTVWSYTVIHRNRTPGFAERVPYVVALVELQEGVKVLSNVIDCDPESVRIGMPVRLTFVKATEQWHIPMFTPA